jgi:hypothetical protein
LIGTAFLEEGGPFLETKSKNRAREAGRRLTWYGGCAIALAAAVAGCAGNADVLPSLTVYEVKGQVLLADGRPLTEGSVYFVPKGGDLPITPSAVIGPDGAFSVVTGGSGEGAPPGDYKIRIETPGVPLARRGTRTRYPFKYTDEDSSGLVVSVRPEPNRLEPFRLR